jgi:hypothetical protein
VIAGFSMLRLAQVGRSTGGLDITSLSCSECEQAADDCKQNRRAALSFANNVSMAEKIESANPSRKPPMIARMAADDCERLHIGQTNETPRARCGRSAGHGGTVIGFGTVPRIQCRPRGRCSPWLRRVRLRVKSGFQFALHFHGRAPRLRFWDWPGFRLAW